MQILQIIDLVLFLINTQIMMFLSTIAITWGLKYMYCFMEKWSFCHMGM